jgi:hypothetical protein
MFIRLCTPPSLHPTLTQPGASSQVKLVRFPPILTLGYDTVSKAVMITVGGISFADFRSKMFKDRADARIHELSVLREEGKVKTETFKLYCDSFANLEYSRHRALTSLGADINPNPFFFRTGREKALEHLEPTQLFPFRGKKFELYQSPLTDEVLKHYQNELRLDTFDRGTRIATRRFEELMDALPPSKRKD